MLQVLAVWHVLISMSLVGLILMHSGRDAGIGGMGFTPQSQGGTHIVERNLTRVTIVVALIFAIGTIVLFRWLAVRGPAHTVRVALADVPWPLPKRPRTRDQLQLAKTLRTFRVVHAGRGEIVVRHGGLEVDFRQLEPHRAAVLFRRGE